MKLYLDLDGVFADFDTNFLNNFGAAPATFDDDEMWRLIYEHREFFSTMPIMPDGKSFFDAVSFMNPIILTACPRSDYQRVARQKIAWVRTHLSTSCQILPVMGGKNKPLFMHSPGDILIDDFAKNCQAWENEGGVAILHTDFKTTRQSLRTFLFSRGDWWK